MSLQGTNSRGKRAQRQRVEDLQDSPEARGRKDKPTDRQSAPDLLDDDDKKDGGDKS